MSLLNQLAKSARAQSEGLYGVALLKDGPASVASPVTLTTNPTVDESAMSVTCVLTSATPDRQGDIIDPTGGDFSEHETNPVVMFHHGKTHKLPIGKAEDPAGNYTVRLAQAPDGSDLLLGTTFFSQKSQFAQDVFGLIAEDIMRGVSIGFDPPADESQIVQLGASPSLDRPALHFKDGWKLLEYSHTPIGVNRDALTFKVHKALEGSIKMHRKLLDFLAPLAAPRKTVVAVTTVTKATDCAGMKPKQRAAVAIAKAKKKKPQTKGYLEAINETQGIPASVPPCPMCGGASVPLKRNTIYGYECQGCGGSHGLADSHQRLGWPQFKPKGMHVIVKALDQTFLRLAPVKVGKAMNDDDDELDPTDTGDVDTDADLPPDDEVAPDDDAAMTGDEPTPAVKSMYDIAQGLLDLKMACEEGMKKSEHSKARKYAAKLCAEIAKTAEDAKQFGDKVASELGAMPSPEGDDAEAVEPEPEPMETDETGALMTKGYAPRRWTNRDFQPAAAPVVTDADAAKRIKSLETELRAAKGENNELTRELTHALDTLQAVKRLQTR